MASDTSSSNAVPASVNAFSSTAPNAVVNESTPSPTPLASMPSIDEMRDKTISRLQKRPCLWQLNVCQAMLEGKHDIISIAGTGAGKTLTFWLPLLFRPDGIQIVVTLLNILGQQNVDTLLKVGVEGIFISAKTASAKKFSDIASLKYRAVTDEILPILSRERNQVSTSAALPDDVAAEADAMDNPNDLLRVVHVSTEQFNKKTVVDNVSFGVSQNNIFAMLGPNGAGKTTTFNMIRGNIIPDGGDMFIADISVIRHPRLARHYLGVCPQFTAIDSQMTVPEHLVIYGRWKGVPRNELTANVEAVLRATALFMYADHLASKLSSGNKRKLSLAIALIGNPSVLLIDEFSTGIDAKMKRDMWSTLRNVVVGKAVVITTRGFSQKSTSQQAGDAVSGNSNDNQDSLMNKAQCAMGLNDDNSPSRGSRHPLISSTASGHWKGKKYVYITLESTLVSFIYATQCQALSLE